MSVLVLYLSKISDELNVVKENMYSIFIHYVCKFFKELINRGDVWYGTGNINYLWFSGRLYRVDEP